MSPSIEAYSVLIIAAFNLALAGVILAQDFRNRTNIVFALLALTAASWGFSVGLYLLVSPTHVALLDFLSRSLYFCGTTISVVFLYFSLVFDSETPPSRVFTFLLFLPTVLFLYLHFFTDLIIAGPLLLPDGIRGLRFGPLRFLIEIELWGYFATAFIVLAQKYRRLSGQARAQIVFILIGTYVTFAIGVTTNDILLNYGVFNYLWVGPTAMILWVSSVAYSVARHQLFNVRVIAAEMLVILLWLILLLRTILSQNETDFLINAGFFLVVLILGVFVIGSVVKDAVQRDLINQQKQELAHINGQQESLLHFISHEVKGYFAKSEAAFAGIGEGDFDDPVHLKTMAINGLKDMRQGAAMVASILDASNLKKGNVSYKSSLFDIKKTVHEVANELRPDAEAKGLAFTITDDVPGVCVVKGDEVKIRRSVIRNLIDNAIRYTQVGSIEVHLSRIGTTVRITVKDSGVGITDEDKKRLFTEGGHGADSQKINAHSTGYGLYIAKQITEAHGGTIRAESEGAGKGSTFVVELPAS